MPREVAGIVKAMRIKDVSRVSGRRLPAVAPRTITSAAALLRPELDAAGNAIANEEERLRALAPRGSEAAERQASIWPPHVTAKDFGR